MGSGPEIIPADIQPPARTKGDFRHSNPLGRGERLPIQETVDLIVALNEIVLYPY
ncbi:MAG: hypothetical protein IPH16_19825 [Haliscomenobacter sp.]|nr:hypothetical protein [Haliscomenobacter sp.]